MPTAARSANPSANSRTVVRTFRITHTQDQLLDIRAKARAKAIPASAIIRALLDLYFNKKIPNVDTHVQNEISKANLAEERRLQELRAKMLSVSNPSKKR